MTAFGPTTIQVLLLANPSLGTNFDTCSNNVVAGRTYCILLRVGWNWDLEEMEANDPITRTITFGNTATSSSSMATTTSSSFMATTTSSVVTTTTSSSTTSSSTSQPTGTPPYYYGCYTEGASSRALTGATTANFDDMTVEYCFNFCTGYDLFGVEYTGECFCGNALAEGAMPTFESQCSMPCAGNANQICGGPSRLNLYGMSPNLPPVTPRSNLPQVTDYAYVGCRTEAPGRALTGASIVDGSSMTVQGCGFYCLNQGFVMFGLEYTAECFCGNSLAPGSNVALESDCNMPCSGEPEEDCGGPDRLSVWLWS
jgi:hypothetical protein